MMNFKKIDLYELNICGIEYWRKTINPQTKEIVFLKHKSEPYTLFLDKIGRTKDMPQINGNYYLDIVSGRLLSIIENENYIIINPSNISIQKDKLIKDKKTFEKVCDVFAQENNEYISISEDVIFNSYFCDLISRRDNKTEISLKQVNEEIIEARKSYIESQAYLYKFKDGEFSPYDFMSLFCALNASQRNFSFNRNYLIKFIKLCKDNNEFNNLLKNIRFKNNGIFFYSEEIDEAIAKLKWGEILYTISPEQDDTIFIDKNIKMSELIKDRISYFDEMVVFLNKYNDYKTQMIKDTQQFNHNETKDIDNETKILNEALIRTLEKH